MIKNSLVWAVLAGLTPQLAQARDPLPDCPDLGLQSDFLAAYYCDQFERIVLDGETRTIGPDQPELPDGPGFEWLQSDLLQEAWRVDPKKTLDLIDRIRTAGGLPES